MYLLFFSSVFVLQLDAIFFIQPFALSCFSCRTKVSKCVDDAYKCLCFFLSAYSILSKNEIKWKKKKKVEQEKEYTRVIRPRMWFMKYKKENTKWTTSNKKIQKRMNKNIWKNKNENDTQRQTQRIDYQNLFELILVSGKLLLYSVFPYSSVLHCECPLITKYCKRLIPWSACCACERFQTSLFSHTENQ